MDNMAYKICLKKKLLADVEIRLSEVEGKELLMGGCEYAKELEYLIIRKYDLQRQILYDEQGKIL